MKFAQVPTTMPIRAREQTRLHFTLGKGAQRRMAGWLLAALLIWAGVARAGNILDEDWKPPVRRQPSQLPVAPGPDAAHGPATQTAPHKSDARAGLPALVPRSADRARSRALLKEAFADRLKDRSPRARRELAKALLDQVASAAGNRSDQYVLLTAAIEAGEQGQSLELAFGAVDRLDSLFDVDGLAIKADAVATVLSAPETGEAADSDAQLAEDVVEQLIRENDFADARRALAAISRHAARTNDSGTLAHCQATMKALESIEPSWQALQGSITRLKASPKDPEANFAVGAYCCFVQGQWDQGLPYLMHGSNDAVKEAAAAQQSLDADADPGTLAEIAGKWWDVAAALPPAYRPAILQHASSLYERAEPHLTGLDLEAAKKRIALARREAPPAPVANKSYSVPNSNSWTAIDFSVTAGQCYEISARGQWRGSTGPECGPEGICPLPLLALLGPQPALKKDQHEMYYLGQHPRSALIGKIADENWTFFVGPSCRFVAPVSGKLSFKINDTDASDAQREGRMRLTITPTTARWIAPDGTAEILARIDDADTFHITPQGVFWVYGGSWGKVGLHDGYYPTVINGIYWWPQWPTKDHTETLPITALWPRNPSQLRLLKVEAKRGEVTVVDQSNSEIVLRFKDNGLGSSQVGCVIAVGNP